MCALLCAATNVGADEAAAPPGPKTDDKVAEEAKPDTKPKTKPDAKVAAEPKPAPKAGEEATTSDPPPETPPKWETADPEHRGGFAMGLTFQGGLGAANGYPNDSKKLGRAAFYTESGLGFASAPVIWLGGAPADWLNMGFGLTFSNTFADGVTSRASLGFFHFDIYPLYALGGPLKNLGTTFEFGTGTSVTTDNDTDEELINGGAPAFVYGGVFWEGIEAWKLKMGPLLAGHFVFSESLRRPSIVAGFRIALYTSP